LRSGLGHGAPTVLAVGFTPICIARLGSEQRDALALG
jgi:hypothetical protein